MERKFVIKAEDGHAGKEIKNILQNYLHCSASIIAKLKEGDFILLNGQHATVRQRLMPGDELTVIIPDKGNENVVPNPEIPVRVIYEDEDVLAVNKPACVATHPSCGHFCDTLANGVVSYMKSEDFTFRAVNRLDRQTGGVVLIAKNMLAAHILGEQLRMGEIKKVYYAVCEHAPSPRCGEIVAPIAREDKSIITRTVSEKGKYAKTIYDTEKEFGDMALVRAEPVTGRTHQIRVHLAHIGCPIFGDDMYGSKYAGERVRLHCKSLTFRLPVTGERITAECELPEDFISVIRRFRG